MVFQKGHKPSKRGPSKNFLAQLDQTTRLYASATQFSLHKPRKVKEGEVEWVGDSFYTTLESAIKGYIKQTTRSKKRIQTDGNLNMLIMAINDLNASVKELVGTFEEKLKAGLLLPLPIAANEIVEEEEEEEVEDA